MLIDEGKCIDYRGIIITRLNRGRADIATIEKKNEKPEFPRRDDRYAVTTGSIVFPFYKDIARSIRRLRRRLRGEDRENNSQCPRALCASLCKQHKNSTRVPARAIGMLSCILPLKSISAMFLTITSRPLSVILPY